MADNESRSVDLYPPSGGGAAALRRRLAQRGVITAPGCYDALTARLIEAAGHEAAFLGGFSVAASRLGLPDVGLLSYGEMADQAMVTCAATALPVIVDADTGYGNAVNAQRTLLGYARAGAACVMIEDQTWPKRCGHTAGKHVVDRAEAVARVSAAVAERDRHGLDVLIMARTDAAATDGFDEALRRADAFVNAGADLTFVEAPRDEREMARYCTEIAGWKTANLVDDGRTPWLDPAALTEIGYSIVLYPVTMLLAGLDAGLRAAEGLLEGISPLRRLSFDDARALVGWPDYERRSIDYEPGHVT